MLKLLIVVLLVLLNVRSGDELAHQPTDIVSFTTTARPTDNGRAPSDRRVTTTTTEDAHIPSVAPTQNPTVIPTQNPTRNPTANPTQDPTRNPTANPTANPTTTPSSSDVMIRCSNFLKFFRCNITLLVTVVGVTTFILGLFVCFLIFYCRRKSKPTVVKDEKPKIININNSINITNNGLVHGHINVAPIKSPSEELYGGGVELATVGGEMKEDIDDVGEEDNRKVGEESKFDDSSDMFEIIYNEGSDDGAAGVDQTPGTIE